ncbi:endonuclease-reverse transcriptase [Elysia marginata]|uniref:Endonuclease-reverse transcriptase n=1 Tax=Elysia marginata TaxID=1093978 RepID=A0AAV4GEL5_9GAST|nr:endonuclease-reverse transcriptase [Elysia marginata]
MKEAKEKWVDDQCVAIEQALATAAFAKLGKIWKSSISFKAKHKLFRSLVSSILTYGCETWTLLADTGRRIQAFENKCLRKLLRISYIDHVTNESVRELVVAYVGPQEPLLATVKRRKLAWFGHVTRHDSLSKTILQGTVEGKRRRGRQKKAWCDNIKEWTALVMYELVSTAAPHQRCSTPPAVFPNAICLVSFTAFSPYTYTANSMVNAESRFVTEYDTSPLDAIPRGMFLGP